MDIPVEVTFSASSQSLDLLDQLEMMQAEIQNAAANEIALQIAMHATKSLHSTREAYLKALTVIDNVITLDTSNFGVHVAEEGNVSFDMKPKMLASPKAKVAKNGQRYISVPLPKFRDGKYNWRDRSSGRFQKGTNDGPVEFRTVSDSSDPGSWIFPQVEGHHFIDATIEQFDLAGFMSDFIKKKNL